MSKKTKPVEKDTKPAPVEKKPAVVADDVIRVRATAFGFMDAKRRPGDEFTIKASQFSAEWMERV